jgi:hypothetical protein
MPDALFERRIDLLLDEKHYVDSQVTNCMQLQLTITGVHFTALAAAAGWIFSRGAGSSSIASSLLVIVALSCFGSAQSIVVNSLMLHYTRYKNFVLGPQFAEALELPQSPLTSLFVLANPKNPSRKLAAIGSVASSAVALAVNLAALVYAAYLHRSSPWWWIVVILIGLGVAGIAVTQRLLWHAQTRTYQETLQMFKEDKAPGAAPQTD